VRALDWVVLCGWLAFIVTYGVWKGRRSRSLQGYVLGDRSMRWYMVAFSVMATQASAITFLSTPGQAYADGMRFVQFYFGLPIAMVVLSVTAIPFYRRLKVYTAYEFLERRFDAKVRTLAASLFLVQRGLACGLTIFAPSLILSVLLGWNMQATIFVIGTLVIIYTASGGTKAVSYTHFLQLMILMAGIFTALAFAVARLPEGVSFGDAVFVAGKTGRLNAIDLTFDWKNRYNIWSGLIGGFFLALSYFGTDQSQVGRYLTGQSVTQSRLGLLFNGLAKVPMQFIILFTGAMVFVFYQFQAPPVYFNPVETRRVAASAGAAEFDELSRAYERAADARAVEAMNLVAARRDGDGHAGERAAASLAAADAETRATREKAIEVVKSANPRSDGRDVNYVFLTFILANLPAGLIGLTLASVFAASMSSTSSELNALASTSIVDVYRRFVRKEASDRHYVVASKAATVVWGAFAIAFAQSANKLGSLVEAVNILGSLFYGTILGIFLLAFYLRRVGGTAVFLGALVGEVAVIFCFTSTGISFLWYNVVGCLGTMAAALAVAPFMRRRVAA